MRLAMARTTVEEVTGRLARRDTRTGEDARAAVEWLTAGEEDDAPAVLTRRRLQLFLWYELPRKCLIQPEEHLAARGGRRRWRMSMPRGREAGLERFANEDRALLQQVTPAPDRMPSRKEAEAAVEPLLWLLGRLVDGVRLTQTGALPRALVREGVERYPDWWDAELLGSPHREATALASIPRGRSGGSGAPSTSRGG